MFTILQPDGYFTTGIPPVLFARGKTCGECGRVHDFECCPYCGDWIEIQYGIGGERKWCLNCSLWSYLRHDSDRSDDLTCVHGRAF